MTDQEKFDNFVRENELEIRDHFLIMPFILIKEFVLLFDFYFSEAPKEFYISKNDASFDLRDFSEFHSIKYNIE